jgi:pyruvate dehydrogenase E2 component (dihydrolipoamide acetyltransferase)
MHILMVPNAIAGLTTATVARWYKTVGEAFRAGETLVQLETEQALIEITAKADGTLAKITAPVGTTLKVGAELAQLGAASAAAVSKTIPSTLNGGHPVANTSAAAGGNATTSKDAQPLATGGAAAIPILMPQAGNSMEEGTILKWRVAVGDQISVGQVLCEIETDKATVEVEATEAGRLAQIVAEAGVVVPVKQPIAYLGAAVGTSAASASGGVAPSAASAASVPIASAASASAPSGAVPILMPQAGNSMEEGTIVKWRVSEGDRITVGQVICEVETDKATVEVEATDAGRVAKIVAPAGTVVPVKQPMAYLSEAAVDVAAVAPAPAASRALAPMVTASPAPAAARLVAPAAVTAEGRIKASPAARKIAQERGLDLASLGAGSGPGGRIISGDLASAQAGAPAVRRPGTAAPQAPATPRSTSVVRRPLSKMRRAIATNLQTSKQTVPHWYIRLTINAEPLFAFYKAQKPATGCTLNDVILLAVGKTVGEFAMFRSRIEGNELVEFPAANIGIAVGVEDGLVVPVVMGVDSLTLAGLAKESRRIVESARTGKLENVGRAVFTISNLGMFGIEEFAAIINPPESGILAISAVRESVVVKDGAIRAARVMTVTLSTDHRVVDGTVAAQFMARLRELLEAPEKI